MCDLILVWMTLYCRVLGFQAHHGYWFCFYLLSSSTLPVALHAKSIGTWRARQARNQRAADNELALFTISNSWWWWFQLLQFASSKFENWNSQLRNYWRKCRRLSSRRSHLRPSCSSSLEWLKSNSRPISTASPDAAPASFSKFAHAEH